MNKTALITGITGQDGSYLAEFLLSQGYEVIGMVRRSSVVNLERIHHIQDKITLVQGDLLDEASLIGLAARVSSRREVYNLAAQSFVPTSWKQPVLTGEFTALGVTRLLDAIMMVNKDIRFYQASSSEMFGKVQQVPQTEKTPFYPRSPYGVAKVYGHWITVNYRESYDLLRVLGHSVQSRIAAARAGICHAQDFAGRGQDQDWAWPKNCAWAISNPSATGALPATMCARCG